MAPACIGLDVVWIIVTAILVEPFAHEIAVHETAAVKSDAWTSSDSLLGEVLNRDLITVDLSSQDQDRNDQRGFMGKSLSIGNLLNPLKERSAEAVLQVESKPFRFAADEALDRR